MVHNINFVEGYSLPKKSFRSHKILVHLGKFNAGVKFSDQILLVYEKFVLCMPSKCTRIKTCDDPKALFILRENERGGGNKFWENYNFRFLLDLEI